MYTILNWNTGLTENQSNLLEILQFVKPSSGKSLEVLLNISFSSVIRTYLPSMFYLL